MTDRPSFYSSYTIHAYAHECTRTHTHTDTLYAHSDSLALACLGQLSSERLVGVCNVYTNIGVG